MRKIYLASQSPARKRLLEILGLEIKVFPSCVKENIKLGKSSYAKLVKQNALAKAKDVAKQVKNGIIIGADTLAVQDDCIYGKPKNIEDARLMLKKLSSKPHWLYTAVAVIDKDNHKTLVSCEKTKVYMDRLSNKEITGYFRKVAPFDMAGSFDIQGKGALFIRRIEGCFYNVVGLPLRRLYIMLKEIGVHILLCLFCLLWAGCSTEYNIVTGKEETYYYSTDKEVQIGQSISRQVEKEYKLFDDPLVQERVEEIGQKIVSVCARKDIDYHFKVIDAEEVNAFALPGGFIYVHKELLDHIANDDELAAILAHEVGHIVARHSIKKLQAIMGYSILRALTVAVPEAGSIGNAADMAFTEIMLGYSREDELLADQLGARYTRLSGYNPKSMVIFLEKLQEINKRKPLRPKNYFRTHPYVPDRIRVVKQELGEKITFTDYINIEDTKAK